MNFPMILKQLKTAKSAKSAKRPMPIVLHDRMPIIQNASSLLISLKLSTAIAQQKKFLILEILKIANNSYKKSRKLNSMRINLFQRLTMTWNSARQDGYRAVLFMGSSNIQPTKKHKVGQQSWNQNYVINSVRPDKTSIT